MTTDGALAEELAMNMLFVVSDCKLVVLDINEDTMGFQELSFAHESRASNFEAHNLAGHMMLHGCKEGAFRLAPEYI
jgi:hypothetical protein